MAKLFQRRKAPAPTPHLNVVSISVVLTTDLVVFYQGDHICKIPKDKIRPQIKAGTMLITQHPTNYTWTLTSPRVVFLQLLPKHMWGIIP